MIDIDRTSSRQAFLLHPTQVLIKPGICYAQCCPLVEVVIEGWHRSVEHKKSEKSIGPPIWLGLVPSCVEGGDVVGDGDAEVGDRHQDGQAELAHQQTYQARLKDVGWKEREENNNQGEDQTDVLNHKDYEEDDALKAEKLGERVDEKINEEEAILHGQHGLVTRQWKFHDIQIGPVLVSDQFHVQIGLILSPRSQSS